MKIEEVIELGKLTENTIKINSWFPSWWVWIVVIIFLLVTISCIVDTVQWRMLSEFWGWSVVLGIITTICWVFTMDAVYIDNKSKWKEEVAKPYIESLPVEQKEVVFIKIDPELSSSVSGWTYFGSGYTTSKTVERTPLVVSYKDNGIATRTDWYETHMELTDKEKPYIEFQRLEKDLGHGVDKGLYNVKVYLPDSYEFTEIK